MQDQQEMQMETETEQKVEKYPDKETVRGQYVNEYIF